MGVREVASGAVGLFAGVAAILMWTIGGKHTPRVVLALVITSSVGFLNTRIGGWIRHVFGWINRLLGEALGWLFGATVIGLIAFICAYILVIDLRAHGGSKTSNGGAPGGGKASGGFMARIKGHNVGNRTLAAGGILPFASISLPGLIGVAIYAALGWVSALIAWGLGVLFGIH
ncbi:MAG: hypothetical protein ACRDR6_10845 [Pseudonocardiaceae bacterium]